MQGKGGKVSSRDAGLLEPPERLYLSFSPLLFTSLLFSAICMASSDSHFAFLSSPKDDSRAWHRAPLCCLLQPVGIIFVIHHICSHSPSWLGFGSLGKLSRLCDLPTPHPLSWADWPGLRPVHGGISSDSRMQTSQRAPGFQSSIIPM